MKEKRAARRAAEAKKQGRSLPGTTRAITPGELRINMDSPGSSGSSTLRKRHTEDGEDHGADISEDETRREPRRNVKRRKKHVVRSEDEDDYEDENEDSNKNGSGNGNRYKGKDRDEDSEDGEDVFARDGDEDESE